MPMVFKIWTTYMQIGDLHNILKSPYSVQKLIVWC